MAGDDIERLRQAALKDAGQVVRLADALVANDRAEEAVQACRRGLTLRPDDVPLRLALGRALSAAGRLEEAQAVLLEAVSRQQKLKGAPPSRGPTAPQQPSRQQPSRLQPMDQTEPSMPSFADGDSTEERATTQRSRDQLSADEGPLPAGDLNLEAVADALFAGGEEEPGRRVDDRAFGVEPDPIAAAWDASRARAFVWLWVSLGLIAIGIGAGWILARQGACQAPDRRGRARRRAHARGHR